MLGRGNPRFVINSVCVCVFGKSSITGGWQGMCPLHHESVKMKYLIYLIIWGGACMCVI